MEAETCSKITEASRQVNDLRVSCVWLSLLCFNDRILATALDAVKLRPRVLRFDAVPLAGLG